MTEDMNIKEQIEMIVSELVQERQIGAGHILVIGASTSEVVGKKIGTAGAEEVAQALHAGIETVRQQFGFHVAFQCCEHLNRALVVERSVQQQFALTEVSAVPVPHAGGSMAAYAYRSMQKPCLIEGVQADAGIDIGDTFIGMHLRSVAVPFRPSIRQIGQAHITVAYTRPKLIGGERAVYKIDASDSNHCN